MFNQILPAYWNLGRIEVALILNFHIFTASKVDEQQCQYKKFEFSIYSRPTYFKEALSQNRSKDIIRKWKAPIIL